MSGSMGGAKTIQVRILTRPGEREVWARRGIVTASDIRAAVVLGAKHPEWLGERVEPSGVTSSVSWHVRFSPAEIKLIDASRGDIPRSRWISEIVGRTTRTAEEIAKEEMLKQLGVEDRCE